MSDIYDTAYAFKKEEAKHTFSKEEILYDDHLEALYKSSIERDEPLLKSSTEDLENADKEFSEFRNMTKEINYLKDDMEFLKKENPKAFSAAISEFCKIVNKEIPASEATSIQKGKKAKVNLNGKSLLGNIKRKVKNFLRPNNTQKRVEGLLSEMKEKMVKDPEYRNFIGRGDKVSYNEFMNSMSLHEKNIDKNRSNALHRLALNEHTIGSHQAIIDHFQEVKDNAAKEIETKMQARENIGIKDAQANTGVDKLAERAKAMEGMSSEQRMAYRLEQLRGTKKPESKPVKQTTLDPKVAERAISGNQK